MNTANASPLFDWGPRAPRSLFLAPRQKAFTPKRNVSHEAHDTAGEAPALPKILRSHER
jgi:hypothetical protein